MELTKLISRIHEESRGTYGWPRIHAELVLGLGETVNRKRVARLMRQAGIQGVHRRKGRKNLASAATEDDLVHRQFTVAELDRLWLTDITEHPTAEGKTYCAAIMDACPRRIIGWSIDTSQKTELVTGAIGMAILRRRPEASRTILHSDHGTQFTSWASGKRLRDAGLLGSMGTAGDCYDNSRPEGMENTERAGERDL
jgi:putative transposase